MEDDLIKGTPLRKERKEEEKSPAMEVQAWVHGSLSSRCFHLSHHYSPKTKVVFL